MLTLCEAALDGQLGMRAEATSHRGLTLALGADLSHEAIQSIHQMSSWSAIAISTGVVASVHSGACTAKSWAEAMSSPPEASKRLTTHAADLYTALRSPSNLSITHQAAYLADLWSGMHISSNWTKVVPRSCVCEDGGAQTDMSSLREQLDAAQSELKRAYAKLHSDAERGKKDVDALQRELRASREDTTRATSALAASEEAHAASKGREEALEATLRSLRNQLSDVQTRLNETQAKVKRQELDGQPPHDPTHSSDSSMLIAACLCVSAFLLGKRRRPTGPPQPLPPPPISPSVPPPPPIATNVPSPPPPPPPPLPAVTPPKAPNPPKPPTPPRSPEQKDMKAELQKAVHRRRSLILGNESERDESEH